MHLPGAYQVTTGQTPVSQGIQGTDMKNNLVLLGIVVALVAPFTASANDDAAYCRALVAKYESLVADSRGGRSRNQGGADTSVALEQCKSGNPAGIPVIEQKLRDSKITLPPRN